MAILSVSPRCSKNADALIINSYQSDEAPKKVFSDLVEQFKVQNPSIPVTVNTFAHEDFKTLLRTWLPNKHAPDVVTWFAGERMRYFADKGLIARIDSVVPGGFEREFPAAFATACQYRGGLYFIPQCWYWWGVYYRKSVFQKYSLLPPATWDEFLLVCETLKKDGMVPLAIGTKAPWTAAGWFDYLDMRVNGGPFHLSVTAGTVPFTDPKIKAVFHVWRQLIDKQYYLPEHTSYEWQAAAIRLFNGEAGMYLMGQFIKDAAPAEVKDDLAFFRFPVIDSSIDIYEDAPIDGFMAPANADHMREAKLFCAFIASAAAQEYMAKNLGRLAANRNVPPPDDHARAGADMIAASKGIMQFFDRDTDPVLAEKGMNAFVEFMMHPEKLDEILAALEKERLSIVGAKQ
jgi:multiple sugar transport system substrate-binding protein